MKLTHETLTTREGTTVNFARVHAGVIRLRVADASWQVPGKGDTWAAFGTLSYLIGRETLTQLRATLGLADDVRIGVATPATEQEVKDFHKAAAAKSGHQFAFTADAQFTCGTDADGTPTVRNGWCNLRLVASDVSEAAWEAVASAAATTGRIVAAASA